MIQYSDNINTYIGLQLFLLAYFNTEFYIFVLTIAIKSLLLCIQGYPFRIFFMMLKMALTEFLYSFWVSRHRVELKSNTFKTSAVSKLSLNLLKKYSYIIFCAESSAVVSFFLKLFFLWVCSKHNFSKLLMAYILFPIFIRHDLVFPEICNCVWLWCDTCYINRNGQLRLCFLSSVVANFYKHDISWTV